MERYLIIRYEWWGLHFKDRRYWSAIWSDTGEAHDYDSRAALVADAKRLGHKYEVRRHHRKGGYTVIETNRETAAQAAQ